MKTENLDKKLGIVGGGQLGKMFLSECNKMNISTSVLDPSEKSPCKSISDKFVLGDFNDFDTVYNFGKDCDIITFEIEHINVKALEALERDGKLVFPKPKTLKIIQDKNIQKSFTLNEISFPCVWKKTKFGYDGFGVKILNSTEDINSLPDSEMIIEEVVPFDKELSVIVSRNSECKINCFETVEMEFNSKSNQVEFVISPANISEEANKEAKELAIKLAESLDLVGVLAVEMFLTKDKIYVNEIAPRPHNSGHFSIEACSSSQYQEHLRAIFNLDLGDTKHSGCAIMINLVGHEKHMGKVFYEGIESIFKIKSANLHIYGKEETRPNRKMGHVTIICDKFEEAYEKAKLIKQTIKVKSRTNG